MDSRPFRGKRSAWPKNTFIPSPICTPYPRRPQHMLIGSDGGLGETWDGGKHYRYFANLPCGQFYHVSVDDREPYCLYGGLQDNGTWLCPSRSEMLPNA